MTMSRIAILLVLAGSPATAQAQSVTAEEAIEVQRRMVTAPAAPECKENGEGEEIVVCGRRGQDSYRVPDAPVAGERVRGEISSGTYAMSSADRCVSRCPQPLQVNILKAVPAIAKGIGRLLGRD